MVGSLGEQGAVSVLPASEGVEPQEKVQGGLIPPPSPSFRKNLPALKKGSFANGLLTTLFVPSAIDLPF